ncbi:MAG: 50S ribosomal protein L11 methyltransferase, partial [Ginsengibacter sp.]
MKKFIKVSFQLSSSGEAEILVANLSEIGFYAFDEEGVNATRHEILLNAYINEADFSEKKIHELLGPGSQYSTEVLIEQNWNEEWESGFQPVCINSFAGIRASFHEPLKNVTHEIVITPKMSFGTGHHATTFLMVEQMEAIQFTNKTVIDFGTGTGVLAILAEKCGAAKVLAIDNDIWSI